MNRSEIHTETAFSGLNARERVFALLDEGSGREIPGPEHRLDSPHLAAQGLETRPDDGIVTALGTIDGRDVAVIATDGSFMGGGIGEISGAKFAAVLAKALEENKRGRRVTPVVLLDSGGVRLQEANYGLLLISEIQDLVVRLRPHVPVIGVIPGRIGCFGGMSMTAGLFTYLIMTEKGRLTLNGPKVIEEEAGKEEWDSSDKQKIWDTTGAVHRVSQGFADELAANDASSIRAAVIKYIDAGVPETDPVTRRTALIREAIGYGTTADSAGVVPDAAAAPAASEDGQCCARAASAQAGSIGSGSPGMKKGRGDAWFDALMLPGTEVTKLPSVRVADTEIGGRRCRLIAVVPDPKSRFPRASRGEVGLEQGLGLAEAVGSIVMEQEKLPVIALVDVPGQAYGFKEEYNGLSFTCAAAVDAYVRARMAGHPVVTVIVGNAVSGAFLAHGLQGSYLIALNDDTIIVHAMSRKSAALVTKRSTEELDDAAAKVPAIAYDIESFNKLGAVRNLVRLENHDDPTGGDIAAMKQLIAAGIEDSAAHGNSLDNRLETDNAAVWRAGTLRVKALI